jgi:hypothetical protein
VQRLLRLHTDPVDGNDITAPRDRRWDRCTEGQAVLRSDAMRLAGERHGRDRARGTTARTGVDDCAEDNESRQSDNRRS